MIIVVNGESHIVPNDKVDSFIKKLVKKHLAQPYFFNLQKIKNASNMSWKYYEEEKWRQGNVWCKKELKLMTERGYYLKINNVVEPEPLKIEIKS